jgi:hypothetical protein
LIRQNLLEDRQKAMVEMAMKWIRRSGRYEMETTG